MEIVNGLFWPRLGPMELLSIRSFLAHGHEYHLWAYGPVDNAPLGCVVRDASEIMPYVSFPFYAQFADWFRYALLYRYGGWWVDTDLVCLKPFDFGREYVFSSETHENVPNALNNVVIKTPAGAPILRYMMEHCAETSREGLPYTALGPKLISTAVEKFGLSENIEPPETFCPVPYHDLPQFDQERPIPPAHAIHLWHGMWKTAKRPMNIFQGLYGRLHDRYDSGSGRILVAMSTCARERYARRAARCVEEWGPVLPANADLRVFTGAALGTNDAYTSLVSKTKAIAQYAQARDYEWLLKVDDDTHLRQITPPDSDYGGWVSTETCDGVLPHCNGGAYWLSRRAMAAVAIGDGRNFSSAEDQWVGLILREQGILPTHLDDYVIHPTAAPMFIRWRPGMVYTKDYAACLQIPDPGRDRYTLPPPVERPPMVQHHPVDMEAHRRRAIGPKLHTKFDEARWRHQHRHC